VGDAQKSPREYFVLVVEAPEQVRVAAFRAALDILRPVLAHVWVSTTPASGSWPADCASADDLARVLAAQPPQVAHRPGTGTDTLLLDPADDDAFALALRSGPFSARVSAMSKDGKLVCATTEGSGQWRLTSTEHGLLAQRLAAVAPGTWLGPVAGPQPDPPRRSPWSLIALGQVWRRRRSRTGGDDEPLTSRRDQSCAFCGRGPVRWEHPLAPDLVQFSSYGKACTLPQVWTLCDACEAVYASGDDDAAAEVMMAFGHWFWSTDQDVDELIRKPLAAFRRADTGGDPID
jgi:hypothetical protein